MILGSKKKGQPVMLTEIGWTDEARAAAAAARTPADHQAAAAHHAAVADKAIQSANARSTSGTRQAAAGQKQDLRSAAAHYAASDAHTAAAVNPSPAASSAAHAATAATARFGESGGKSTPLQEVGWTDEARDAAAAARTAAAHQAAAADHQNMVDFHHGVADKAAAAGDKIAAGAHQDAANSHLVAAAAHSSYTQHNSETPAAASHDAYNMTAGASALKGGPNSREAKVKEAGRKISAKNLTAIQTAHTELGQLLAKVARSEDAPKEEDTTVTTQEAEETSVLGDLVPLVEKSISRDGTTEIKVIRPGWGSSGYYKPEVLERDGPKAFPKGTKMFWNHPTLQEERDRPERDLRDLAAEFIEDSTWKPNHPKGPGLYARAKVFDHYKGSIDQLAPHIGVSIRALGSAKPGIAEGKKGNIIEKLTLGRSVDFVTEAGAGGEVMSLFEAARPATSKTEETGVELKEVQQQLEAKETELRETKERADRAEEQLVIREAGDVVAAELAKVAMPDVTKDRLQKQLSSNPPAKEGKLDSDTLVKNVEAAIKAEAEYLAKVTGRGSVKGLGGNGSIGGEDSFEKDMAEAFAELGLSEASAKVAARGRN